MGEWRSEDSELRRYHEFLMCRGDREVVVDASRKISDGRFGREVERVRFAMMSKGNLKDFFQVRIFLCHGECVDPRTILLERQRQIHRSKNK